MIYRLLPASVHARSRMRAVGAIAVLSATLVAAAEVPGLRPDTELFVDDIGIEKRENVVRRVYAARKEASPVIEPDRPWEEDRIYVYGTAYRDPATGKFQLWYAAPAKMLYATSDDGLRWTKPELGITDYQGRKTNIVLPVSHGSSVLVDQAERDPSRRYKALIAEPIRTGGFLGYYSADGVHWRLASPQRIFADGSEMGHLVRDPATKKYFAYIRPYPPRRFPKNENEKRLGAVVTSDDFLQWSEMTMTLTPDATDDAWVTAPTQRTEFYAMHGFAYGRSYLGVIPVFRITKIHEREALTPNQSTYDGPMEGQLITSRDGIVWRRMETRDPVIPSGSTYDQSVMNVATMPILVDDEIWLYYTAINTTHGGPMPPKRISIALARWRLDGYASLSAGATPGVVETKVLPSHLGGARLEVNADATRGRVVVEVLDASGRVKPGFGQADCEPLTGDNVRHRVRWQGGDRLPADEPIRLRFRLHAADLYSYTPLQS